MKNIKVKIFTTVTTNGFSTIEEKIDKWIEKVGDSVEIKAVKQSAFVDSMKADRLVLSIWYVEEIE